MSISRSLWQMTSLFFTRSLHVPHLQFVLTTHGKIFHPLIFVNVYFYGELVSIVVLPKAHDANDVIYSFGGHNCYLTPTNPFPYCVVLWCSFFSLLPTWTTCGKDYHYGIIFKHEVGSPFRRLFSCFGPLSNFPIDHHVGS